MIAICMEMECILSGCESFFGGTNSTTNLLFMFIKTLSDTPEVLASALSRRRQQSRTDSAGSVTCRTSSQDHSTSDCLDGFEYPAGIE